jgi:4-amino-4-deoxy-L-arabinose transferase-like glycosyltransferase
VSLRIRLFRDDQSCLLLLFPLSFVLFTTGLGGRALWAPDEPRTGVVTREIVASGSWAALSDNGRPYVEKPPLYFWLAAAASLAAGRVSELSLRLPSCLAALLGVVSVFYLGRALFGRRVGTLAAVVLATAQNYFMEARWAHTDMLWTLFLLLACLAFQRAHALGGSRPWLGVFYLAMGGAVLTKGPAGLLLPLLAVAIFLGVLRDWRFLGRAGLWWGLPLACLPAGAWLAAYGVSAGAPFPLGEALARIGLRFTRGLHHPQPLTHFLLSLPIDFLPWTLLLPAALLQTVPRRGGRRDRDNAYLYSWIAAIASVFALAAEKRGVYLLPLLPLLALLVARVWDAALMGWDPSPVDRPIALSLLAGLALAGGAAAYYLPRLAAGHPDLVRPAALLAGAAAAAAVAALAAHRRFGGGAALAVFAAGLAGCYLVVSLAVLPALDRYKSARPFARRIAETARGAPLGIYPDYHAAFVFYAGRPITVLQGRRDLRAFLTSAPRAFCLMEEDQFEVERRMLDVGLSVVERERVGHRAMLLVAAGPPAP